MSVETLQPVAPSPEGSDPLSGLGKATELGLVDTDLLNRLGGMTETLPAFADRAKDETPVNQLTIGSEERPAPDTELISEISDTVGAFVLKHATGRDASDAHEQANMASGLSALGNTLTKKDTTELMATRASVEATISNPLPIDAILTQHARNSAEFTRVDDKKRKRRKSEPQQSTLLDDAIARAEQDQN